MADPDRRLCPVHGIPDCSPLLNGCSLLTSMARSDDAIRERDEARARLAAVIAECDRIEADANVALEYANGGSPFGAAWTRRRTAERIRAVARGEDE